jgi:hypothetical protein
MHIFIIYKTPISSLPFAKKKRKRISDSKVTSLILSSLHPLDTTRKKAKAETKCETNRSDRTTFLPLLRGEGA